MKFCSKECYKIYNYNILNKYNKEYRIKNKDKLSIKRKEYINNNKDKINEYFRKRNKTNKYKAWKKEYRKRMKLHISKKVKEYYNKNKKIILQKNKIYQVLHKDELRIKKKEYYNKREKIDLDFKLSHRIKSRIRIAIKHNYKHTRTTDLIGCSIKKLRKHIESKWTEGMSWNNYGYYGWHIDHIIPCDSFDLTKIEEQKKCFHYTNLQPLWRADNLEKSNKLNWVKK
jgi:hypothetical protein